MYKVFINEHLIILTNKITKKKSDQVYMLETVEIEDVIDKLKKKDSKTAYFYHKDKKQLLSLFKQKLPLVIAAGGLVINKRKRILFIFRNNKWDLPKGKLDKGETIEEAAAREVEEETGVKELKIKSFLTITYHIFKRNGVYKLKETHWYLMKTKYDGKLYPQAEEDIEIVKWKSPSKVRKALKKSYHNIKSVIAAYQEIN